MIDKQFGRTAGALPKVQTVPSALSHVGSPLPCVGDAGCEHDCFFFLRLGYGCEFSLARFIKQFKNTFSLRILLPRFFLQLFPSSTSSPEPGDKPDLTPAAGGKGQELKPPNLTIRVLISTIEQERRNEAMSRPHRPSTAILPPPTRRSNSNLVLSV